MEKKIEKILLKLEKVILNETPLGRAVAMKKANIEINKVFKNI